MINIKNINDPLRVVLKTEKYARWQIRENLSIFIWSSQRSWRCKEEIGKVSWRKVHLVQRKRLDKFLKQEKGKKAVQKPLESLCCNLSFTGGAMSNGDTLLTRKCLWKILRNFLWLIKVFCMIPSTLKNYSWNYGAVT